jgi:hypothetical protein
MVMISTQVSELELEDFQGKVTQNVVLPNVSWQTYKALLADMGDHRAYPSHLQSGSPPNKDAI